MDASEQKLGSRSLKAWKRIVIVLAVAAAILAAVFLAGRSMLAFGSVRCSAFLRQEILT